MRRLQRAFNEQARRAGVRDANFWHTPGPNDYTLGATTFSTRPPCRITYCTTPDTGKVDAPCGHQSKMCMARIQTCPDCLFAYCELHYPHHVRRFAWPRQAWSTIQDRYVGAKDRVIDRRSRIIRFRTPPLRVEHA